MLICDKPTVSSFDHFFGAALDVMMHESEHGVLKYTVGELPYQNATGTIDEGYADIFACIKDKNWQLGEELFNPTNHFRCMRDIAVLSSDNILNKRKLYALDVIYAVYKNYKPSSNNDYNSVHYNSHIVSHPAYLMHQDSNPVNGLTWDELGKVWYKSMYMGLSASSKFEDVRRCVLWSAQEINLPANKIATIKSAFDKVGITASTQKATLKGTVTDYDTSNNLSSVDVAVFDGRISGDAVIGKLFVRKSTPSTGRYSFELEAGTYPVIMQKDGYVMFTGLTTITKSEDTTLDVKLVRLGNGSLSGTVRSTPENSLLQGVTVNVRSGWNVQTGSVVQTTITDADGYYSFASINNGYYTVELVKSGFETAMLNVIVSGNTEEQDGYLSIGIVGDIPINEEHFPDQAFRSFISRYIDTNHDNVLSIEEIENTTRINHPLYPSYSGTRFSSLQGIEYFTHLTYLNCNYHTLTDLDLSKNIALRELYCYSNRLANLNVRGCASLQILWCRDNLLTTLDVTGCNSLQELSCHDNQLITLKVNNCISLQFLECSHNQIISLDVNDCTALQNLNCYDNQLTVLDLTQNTLLQGLSCTDNKLTTLNLSNCTVLHNLLCYDNQLVTLDVSNCTALERLECGNNQLTTLDVSHCVALQTLQCGNNQLASLNVNNCSALKYLICPNNQISVLDLSTCVALQGLSCKNNLFTELDLTHCPSLNTVNCDSGVEVKYAPSSNKANLTSHTSALNMRAESDTLILAVIPAFIADHTGTYCFTALIDREPPESSSLLLLSNSEDIHGTFTETESPLCVKVSADLLAGRTYAPVIVAISEDESQNSGCNAGITGIIMIAGIIIIALPKSFIQRLIVLKNN